MNIKQLDDLLELTSAHAKKADSLEDSIRFFELKEDYIKAYLTNLVTEMANTITSEDKT